MLWYVIHIYIYIYIFMIIDVYFKSMNWIVYFRCQQQLGLFQHTTMCTSQVNKIYGSLSIGVPQTWSIIIHYWHIFPSKNSIQLLAGSYGFSYGFPMVWGIPFQRFKDFKGTPRFSSCWKTATRNQDIGDGTFHTEVPGSSAGDYPGPSSHWGEWDPPRTNPEVTVELPQDS